MSLVISFVASAIDFLIIIGALMKFYTEKIKSKLPKLEIEFTDKIKEKKEKEAKEKLI